MSKTAALVNNVNKVYWRGIRQFSLRQQAVNISLYSVLFFVTREPGFRHYSTLASSFFCFGSQSSELSTEELRCRVVIAVNDDDVAVVVDDYYYNTVVAVDDDDVAGDDAAITSVVIFGATATAVLVAVVDTTDDDSFVANSSVGGWTSFLVF